MKIYHNPRCRKSRETLALITAKEEDVEVIEYLNTPPTKTELTHILKLLGIPAQDLIRKSEPIYKEKFKGKSITDDEWVSIMVEYPKLIERPIVLKGNKAIIGRPPENVLELL